MKKIFLLTILFSVTIANAQVRNYTGNNAAKKPTSQKGGLVTDTKKSEKSYSDSDSDSGSKFGIVAGLQFSDEKGDMIETTAARTGFYAGVTLQNNFSETLGLELGLIYSTMGAEFNDQYKDELDYLQMPITLNIKVLKILKIKIGPQIGYLTSAYLDGEDYSESINEFDYGLIGGLAIVIPNTNFSVEGKFYYGLADINANENSVLGEIKNTSYSVGINYYF